MKFIILFFAFAALAAASEVDPEIEDAWVDFKVQHGKLFLSPGKEKKRKEAFADNYKSYKVHNAAFERGEIAYPKQIGPYSDLRPQEFMKRFTGVRFDDVKEHHHHKREHVAMRTHTPAVVDLRTDICVGPIKNQNPCGSCWAFSTLAAVEYTDCKKSGNVLTDLSEQHLVDCVYDRDGCEGGWMSTAMEWIRDNEVAIEEEYPYNKKYGKCNKNYVKKPKHKHIKMKGHKDKKGRCAVYISDHDDDIRAAVNTYGVLAICVDAGDWDGLQGFTGILTKNNYNNAECTHAVNLVGYNFSDPSKPYWIVRNSWDTWFGEKGYIKIDARRDPHTKKNMGGFFTNRVIRPDLE
ncbi:uncharacterized protein LOC134833244 [Culicoides brevitarsis]|uniref:uncharacterized protein LOC134833244 n=1 Tax=Culicoides brevitarsis TaxID=469753 RepID=UPI00307C5E5B